MTQSVAYYAGALAADRGQSKDSNPHQKETPAWYDWRDGWIRCYELHIYEGTPHELSNPEYYDE